MAAITSVAFFFICLEDRISDLKETHNGQHPEGFWSLGSFLLRVFETDTDELLDMSIKKLKLSVSALWIWKPEVTLDLEVLHDFFFAQLL